MSLEKIVKKIIDDAKAEADRIILESQKKADEIKRTAQEEASRLAEAFIKEEERKGQLEASRLVTQARLEGRIHILSCKRELIEETLDKAFRASVESAKTLKRTIVLKDGKKEETLEGTQLKDELRPKLEKNIAEALKI